MEIVSLLTQKRYFPGTPMLLVVSISTIAGVREPLIVKWISPSSALKPAYAFTLLASPNDH